MKNQRFKTWVRFNTEVLHAYDEMAASRCRQLIFRGHGDSRWGLQTTLDRVVQTTDGAARAACLHHLIEHFKRQARSIDPDLRLKTELEWELLGRHHGLPTTVLDFSFSPYVAAYFAFADTPPGAKYASIWMLDRQVFDGQDIPQLAILDDEDSIRFNPRAHEQRGLFLQVKDVSRPVEDLLGDALVRYDISVSQREIVLAALDRMTINARNLFRDLDAAAKTAACRVLVLRED